jgi:UDP-glucuronate 4-epimerase
VNILVTGGAGFIGSHLCERLLREGHEVECLDDFNDFYDPAIKRRNIEPLLGNRSFGLTEGNILDTQLLTRAFGNREYDVVIHLAARAGVRPSIEQPLLYQEVNCHGTHNLLEKTKEFGVPKFVFASSSSVYGNNKKVPFSEDDPVDFPVSPYAATKKSGELICYTYHHLTDISVVCLRFFTVYGPRQRPDMAIHKFTRLIDEGEKVPMYGDGKSRRDYTYFTDVVDGIMGALAHCSGYRIYNLGESQTVELRRLIDMISERLGKPAVVETLPEQPGDVRVTYADIGRARRELGYSPRVSIEEGIGLFVDWYRANRQ